MGCAILFYKYRPLFSNIRTKRQAKQMFKQAMFVVCRLSGKECIRLDALKAG